MEEVWNGRREKDARKTMKKKGNEEMKQRIDKET
jgi:hypothetical protein